jgi:hypothetical protein
MGRTCHLRRTHRFPQSSTEHTGGVTDVSVAAVQGAGASPAVVAAGWAYGLAFAGEEDLMCVCVCVCLCVIIRMVCVCVCAYVSVGMVHVRVSSSKRNVHVCVKSV